MTKGTASARIPKCPVCRKRRGCLSNSCRRYGCLDVVLAPVLKKSFGIKSLYNYQREILEFYSKTGPQGLSLQASDLCVYVPTGYGKTMAYVLCILDHFLRNPSRMMVSGVHCIILLPTKELAHQVFHNFVPFAQIPDLPFSAVLLGGEHSVYDERLLLQGRSVAGKGGRCRIGENSVQGPHILVAVASRLAVHAPPLAEKDNPCNWSTVTHVVVDEADRLLAAEYGSWLFALQHICLEKDLRRGLLQNTRPGLHQFTMKSLAATECPETLSSAEATTLESAYDPLNLPGIHKMVLTATQVQNFKGFRLLRLNHPINIFGTLDEKSVAKLKEKYWIAEKGNKALLIQYLMEKYGKKAKILVFCSSTRVAEAVVQLIIRTVGTTREPRIRLLLASAGTRDRQAALRAFRHGEAKVLVSTDVASRGLHVDGISAVVHWDLPVSAEAYVHRVGRSARAGHRGLSVAILSRRSEINRIQQLVDQSRKYRQHSSLSELKFV